MTLVAVVAVALTLSRRPDSVTHAQFWAEDGTTWYAEAYNLGWLQATMTAQTAYFQTISRLTAALSLLIDFGQAPLVFNLVALTVQVLPAVLIVTRRFERLVPDVRVRLLLAFLYVAVPNSFELDANITNAMTHLALVAVMVVLAQPSSSPLWRAFDVAVVSLSGLSGPFVLALVGVAALRWLTARARWTLVLLTVAVATAAVQVASLASFHGRITSPLGATPSRLVAIIARQVFAGAVLGFNHYLRWPQGVVLEALVFAAGMAVLGYVLLRRPGELRLLVLFAAVLLAGALVSPVVSNTEPQWQAMTHAGAGNRYYLIPMLAWLASLVWVASRARWPARLAAAMVLLGALVIGVPADWRYPAYRDFEPKAYARVLDQAPHGSRVVIPINPSGWEMVLVKR